MDKVYEQLNIDRNSAIPLYYQFKQFLIDKINSGELLAGDMVPSEEELRKFYTISRPTLRQAFSELVHEGYLVRHRAKGTFISKPRINSKAIDKIVQFHEEMESVQATYHTIVRRCEIGTCENEVRRKLLLPDNLTICIERLRIVNGEPLLDEETFIPAHLFPGMVNTNFAKESLYEEMKKFGYQVARVERSIIAISANDFFSKLLKIENRTPILCITTICFSPDDIPIEYSRAYYRSDRYKINLDIVTSEFKKKNDVADVFELNKVS
ncbi:MAG: GntR family transcriptional regulator [Erysipelotrichaceae bacterium]